MAETDREFAVNIATIASGSKEAEKNNNGGEESSSKPVYQGSQTKNQGAHESSWKPPLSRTKSRLADPPEEPYQKWEKVIISSRRLVRKDVLEKQKLWDLPLWKWEILVLALNCGRAVQNCLWLGLVLLVWNSVFDKKVEEKSKSKSKILLYVTKILVCFLVGNLIWLLKTLMVKVLALSFHVNNYFDRIQEALFNQYVVETLSGPPKYHMKEDHLRAVAVVREFQKAKASNTMAMPSDDDLTTSLLIPSNDNDHRFSRQVPPHKHGGAKFSTEHLHKLNQKNISAWNMRKMIDTVRNGSLATLDEKIQNSNTDDESSLQIKTECQAKEAAKEIFANVAKFGSKYIYLEDLMKFMNKEEAIRTMHVFGATSELNEGITKMVLKEWVVNALRERRALALSLNDTKTAVDELHNMVTVLVGFIIVIISLLILGVPIMHFLVFISSQLLLAVFIFGNTCRTVFEAIIFLFIVHPFDVGDRCEVDEVQMVVEEMNILTTVFMRYDNQKIIYPNSALSTKPIVNFYRSPDMGDSVDFCVHISTPMDKIVTIKEKIKRYIESRSDHWQPSPIRFMMMDVVDSNNLKLSMCVTHRMNHQDIKERWSRRALLVEEMVKIFKQLQIEYTMLPLDVNIPTNSNFKGPTSFVDHFHDCTTK
uniref:Mechanosensitive ion channel MscS domain-containing protein n=1 Tax=Cannabis sativa TaxID=3483 RepID=A0A803NK41_CANSA